MRLFLAALTLFWLTQSAFACMGGVRNFDWGDPSYAPWAINAAKKAKETKETKPIYFIGRVASFYGRTDGSGKQFAKYGQAKIDVLKIYTDNEIKPTELQVYFNVGTCPGRLSIGQIGLFAFRTVDSVNGLLSYKHGF